MKLLLSIILTSISLFGLSQSEFKYYDLDKLNTEKKEAVKVQDYNLAANIKAEIERRMAEVDKLSKFKIRIKEAIKTEDFAKADSLKKEITRLEALERNRQLWSSNANTNKQVQKDSIDLLLGNNLSNNKTIAPKKTFGNAAKTSSTKKADSQNTKTLPRSNLNTIDLYMDKQNLNYVGLSLRFSQYGFFLEGGTLRWKLAKQFYGGEYIGLMFTSEQIITSFGLEGTYMFDYGAQFVPYASTAAFMTVFSYDEYSPSTGETETKWDAGIGGFVKGGFMLFFKKQKSSAFYANMTVGFRGGLDYRMGVYLAINKK